VSELDDLIAACVAAPDDDAPRLVWADAVGGERGELVVIQCKLATGGLPPAETGALLARQDQLLAEHGKAWSGFDGVKGARYCTYRRGFVDALEVDTGELHWPKIFMKAPLVTALSVRGLEQTFWHHDESMPKDPVDPIRKLGLLLDAPELPRLRSIELDDARIVDITGDTEFDYYTRDVLDAAFELIAKTGKLGGFRALGFRNEYTSRGLRELIGSNALASVERLLLQYGDTPPDVAAELFAATPKLRALDAYASMSFHEVIHLLPRSIVELRGIMRREGLAALSASPLAATLERLAISNSEWMPPADVFGPFPKLRALDFYGITDSLRRDGGPEHRAQVAAFASLAPQLPDLRELRIVTGYTPEDLLVIAEAFGPQLARFEIHELPDLPLEDLRRKVAGQVALFRFSGGLTDRLLHASTDTRAPWLGDAPIELQRY
jgi:uncharacterized protein (TIGR02996 family)